MGRVFQTGVERVLFLFLNDFIEQFPMIQPWRSHQKSAYTTYFNPCSAFTIPLPGYASLICLS
ncbi:putative protein YneK [Shigella flexneri]